jgi:hypothetical protein
VAMVCCVGLRVLPCFRCEKGCWCVEVFQCRWSRKRVVSLQLNWDREAQTTVNAKPSINLISCFRIRELSLASDYAWRALQIRLADNQTWRIRRSVSYSLKMLG